MLGRQVGSALLRLPINARLALRPSPFQCQHDLTSRILLLSSQRFFATPGRPKKAVGEPSRPVKRAVKRAAKSSSTGEAGQQVQQNKRSARAKKGTAKKTTAKKAGPKKRVKKALTDEQKAVQEARVSRVKIRELKKTALSPPHTSTSVSAYNIFMREKLKGSKLPSGAKSTTALPQLSKEANQQWKEISPAELEHYNHLAQQEREARQALHKRWVESHTPEQINQANNARAQLKRKLQPKGRGQQKYQPIKDERQVKRPLSAFMQFSINRNASGDFRNIAIPERAKLISQEWKSLSESEKKKYKDLQSEDRSRYSSEYNDVFGHDPPYHAAAAAA